MTREETALNLRPGDEVKIDENWWIVTEHSVDFREPAPVTMQLNARDDREFFCVIATHPSALFVYSPR